MALSYQASDIQVRDKSHSYSITAPSSPSPSGTFGHCHTMSLSSKVFTSAKSTTQVNPENRN